MDKFLLPPLQEQPPGRAEESKRSMDWDHVLFLLINVISCNHLNVHDVSRALFVSTFWMIFNCLSKISAVYTASLRSNKPQGGFKENS